MDSERLLLTLVPTGDPRVDAAIGGLASLDETGLAARPAVLEEVHGRLREILGELGDPGRPGTGAPARLGESGDPARPGPAAPARPGEPGQRGEQGELGPGSRPVPSPQRP